MSSIAASVEEVVAVSPPVFFDVSSLYMIEEHKKFIDRGGKIKVITDLTYEYLEPVRKFLDVVLMCVNSLGIGG